MKGKTSPVMYDGVSMDVRFIEDGRKVVVQPHSATDYNYGWNNEVVRHLKGRRWLFHNGWRLRHATEAELVVDACRRAAQNEHLLKAMHEAKQAELKRLEDLVPDDDST